MMIRGDITATLELALEKGEQGFTDEDVARYIKFRQSSNLMNLKVRKFPLHISMWRGGISKATNLG